MPFDNIRLFKALANDKRLMILSCLIDEKMRIKDLASMLDIAPAILFQHLRVLVSSGLVATQKIGKTVYYFYDREGGETALALFRQLISSRGVPSAPRANPPA